MSQKLSSIFTLLVIFTVALVLFSASSFFVAGKIMNKKKFVVLELENRGFSHLFGYSKQLGIKTLTGNEFNRISTLDPKSPKIFVNDQAKDVVPLDPDHTTYAQTSKIYGMKNLLDENYKEEMDGFVEFEWMKHGKDREKHNKTIFSIMESYSPAHLPVFNQLAAEFSIFENYFCSVPGSTWPNRQYLLAATSESNSETYFWKDGKPGRRYKSKLIFDQIQEEGGDWRVYYEDSLWENFLETIIENPEKSKHYDQFYEDCASGNLPTMSFLNPRGGVNMSTGEAANDHHPDHSTSLAESLVRDVYHAVRNSPLWPSGDLTLIVAYDEGGGLFDPVTPPTKGVPPPSPGESGIPDWFFKFDRLGPRVPLLVINPLIPKGTVVSEPPVHAKPFNTSQFEHTSIMSTMRKMLGMSSNPLTKRDAWAAQFDYIFNLTKPRNDTPSQLVPPLPPSRSYIEEGNEPINHLQRSIMEVTHLLTDGHPLRATPHHSVLTKQREVAAWCRETTDTHHRLHALHKESEKAILSEYDLVIGPTVTVEWIGASIKWDVVNGSECGQPDRWIIHTRDLTDSKTKNKICLTHNLINSTISFAPCFPSGNACKNHRPTQWWYVDANSMIRAYDDRKVGICGSSLAPQFESPVLRKIEPQNQPACSWTIHEHSWKHPGSMGGGGELTLGNGVTLLALRKKKHF